MHTNTAAEPLCPMNVDMMDFDINPQTHSGEKRPSSPARPSSESSAKRVKLDLSNEQRDSVNKCMIAWSARSRWHSSLPNVNKDPNMMTGFLTTVLLYLVAQLTTVAKAATVAPMTPDEAFSFIKGFNAKERNEFVAGLHKGVNEHNWTDLMTHPKLQVSPVKTKALEVPIKHQNAVNQAWKAKYLGASHQVLLKAIDRLNNQPPTCHYVKILAIIQSSGTGKSRTVDEIAKERVLLPLVLREEIEKNYFGYPPIDRAVRNHLLGAPSAEEQKCKDYLRAFLISLFGQALNQTKTFTGGKKTSYLALAKMFYDFFSDSSMREEFYRKVVQNASSVDIKSLDSTLQSLTNALRLCDDLPNNCCLLLFGIDEVHILFEQRKEDAGSNHTIFSHLKSIFSELIMHSLYVVTLSTAGPVSELAPSQDVAPSICGRGDDLILPTPFTQLPFDIDIVSDPLVPARETLSSVGLLKFAARFGRPLFFASYKSRLSQGAMEEVIAMEMMTIIREKLCGFRWPPRKPAVMDASSFAVLSARFLLDIPPKSSHFRKFEEDQVHSHLRMLYSVLRHQDVIFTGSSPEPLIAEASAEVMHHRMSNGSPYMDIWELLTEFISDGLIVQGAVREMIGRVLSLLAMDDAIDALAHQSQLKYQAPVSIAAYYKALLTDDAWNILRKSVPANASQLSEEDSTKTFEDAFEDAYIHFSHYAKTNDDTPLMDHYLWALWLRGTAILCQLTQNLTDRALPIYFSKLGGVGPNSMSVALDQDQVGLTVDPALVSVQSAEVLHVHHPGKSLPYIDAVHCYALTQKEGIKVGKPPHHAPCPQPQLNLEAPRYRIEISGLAPYRPIDEHGAHKIRAMIDGTKNGLFVRQLSQDVVPLLRQQQPLLNGAEATTAWFGGLPL